MEGIRSNLEIDSWLGKRVTIQCGEPSKEKLGVFHRVNHIYDWDDGKLHQGLTHEKVTRPHEKEEDSNVNVDFSFCLVLIVRLNYVLNLKKQNKFLSQHKLSPVNLPWLSQVYGKMFSFPIS